MVTVAIVGILAAFAYPAYQSQVRSTRRADAQTELLRMANVMERFFTENSAYDVDLAGIPVTVVSVPSLAQSSATDTYNIGLVDLLPADLTASTYTLRATPIKAQVGDGFLEITETGVRRWDQNNNTVIGAGESDWEK